MELLKLDNVDGSPTRMQPVSMFEKYESLVWAERYSSNGDFELVSYDIGDVLSQLPLESFVAIRESTVPMVVETHKIEESNDAPARITVTGRSMETLLERRVSVNELSDAAPKTAWVENADENKSSDAAYKVMRKVLGDVARSTLPAISPTIPEDAIQVINLPLPTDYTTGTGTPYEIKTGNLYSVVIELLNVNRHAIRAVRPGPFQPTKSTVDLEIYNGADLRETAVFDARYDQFISTSYLLSMQGSANIAYVYGPNGGTIVKKNTGTTPAGLARRVIVLDEAGEASLTTNAKRRNRGLVELYKNNAVALFDSEVAKQAGELFNKPVANGGYGLGDIVKLMGKYGLSQDVRVAEFIRTSDSSGESSYPTFEVIEDGTS